jgi:redox-sensitive bicupin YhaK (pirin superfamily)
MQTIRKSAERGYADHGWLKSRHTFSFAGYHDPRHMGFRALRVINEDRIAGGTGFDAHPHRDMEIISYVVTGALAHKDSMGNAAVIRPGEVQRMTAGTGVVHAEYNERPNEETHFFQIWVLPASRGDAPGYGQKSFAAELAAKKLVLVVSPDGRDGSISIRQDADLHLARLAAGDTVALPIRPGRGVWVQVVKGGVSVNGASLAAGDAAALENEPDLTIRGERDAELLVFDLA